MGESDKIRDRILPMLEGKTVLDLGCGRDRIVPWAIGVDSWEEQEQRNIPNDLVQCGVDSPLLKSELEFHHFWTEYDVVFSSHTLEHVRRPVQETLRSWIDLVKKGGHLILYLPDERHYKYNPRDPLERNPAHVHFFTYDTFLWHTNRISNIAVRRFEEDIAPPDRYSFLLVAQRVR